jgi:SpoVK/Ycf46/Vps4 family AAA+-type ATPase
MKTSRTRIKSRSVSSARARVTKAPAALSGRAQANLAKVATDLPRTKRTGNRVHFIGPDSAVRLKAAHVLAGELNVSLQRVDLSAVVSKYIGETEKNLRKLFAKAAATGAILFFDEADALFGKRTEVKDAHDRYANLEVSYLLQRIEEYPGIVIVATNLKAKLPPTFRRRFPRVVKFTPPKSR